LRERECADLERGVNTVVSWYEATAKRGEVLSALTSKIDADVCVVGAGFAGLTTALELAKRGQSVVLLEAGRVAGGASGRNGGFVSNGFALGVEDVAKRVGMQQAHMLYDLSRLGTDYVRQTIATHDPALKQGDGLRVCMRHDDNGGLHDYGRTLQKEFGEDVALASADDTRSVLDTQRYFSSLVFPRAFHIHPLRYGLLLLRLCLEAGVKVFENSKAISVGAKGAAVVIRANTGSVEAKHVVYCVSSLDRSLHPPTGRAILPVSTYVAVTEPLEQSVIRTTEAIADTRRAGDYYRVVEGNRILWGGRITTRISEPARLAEAMRGDMLSIFPKLGKPKIDFAWPGLMAYALHKMPLIGRDQEGHWFATGFGGHGLNTTAMAGVLLAQAIAEGDQTYQQFGAFKPQWAFGPLGRVGVQATYWKMQLRDKWEEGR
jgi:gamma-glutamylputrescine oxidase